MTRGVCAAGCLPSRWRLPACMRSRHSPVSTFALDLCRAAHRMGRRDFRRIAVRPRHGSRRHLRLRDAAAARRRRSESVVDIPRHGHHRDDDDARHHGLARIRLTEPLSYEMSGAASQRLADLLGLGGTVGRTSPLRDRGGNRRSGIRTRGHCALRQVRCHGSRHRHDCRARMVGDRPCRIRSVRGAPDRSFTFWRRSARRCSSSCLPRACGRIFPWGAVLGVVTGAVLEAKTAGHFRWEAPDDAREMKRDLLGAFLMGSGGIAALGSTIGQGISGLASLAIGSIRRSRRFCRRALRLVPAGGTVTLVR